MDQQAYFPLEMQFYIFVMFLDFPNEIHKEKPTFLDFENNWLPTDGPTDGLTRLSRCEDASDNEKKLLLVSRFIVSGGFMWNCQ